jgi:toxin ParE1/3/4
MTYQVEFSTGAKQDLFKIYRYIKDAANLQTAKHFSAQIKKACLSLSEIPDRGHIPEELKGLSVMLCRQIIFKNYRISYQVIGKVVVVSGIIDGHRQIREVMRQRMLI